MLLNSSQCPLLPFVTHFFHVAVAFIAYVGVFSGDLNSLLSDWSWCGRRCCIPLAMSSML